MQEHIIESKIAPAQSHYLWFLTLTYTMMMVFANWFAARLVTISGISTDAGTVIFPLTFLLSDLITEVYGYKQARRAIWCGFLFNAIFICYGQIVIHLPSPTYAIHNINFDTLLAMNTRIIFASTLSYIISEPLNSYIMAKLKMRMHGRYLGLRFIASTLVASGVDSFTFCTLAFYGSMPNISLIYFILTMWSIKVLVEILGVPISMSLTKKLKRIEKMDIYDKNTNFNLFKLDASYSSSDNDWK